MTDPATDTAPPGPKSHSLREVAWLYLKLGTIAFGGPAAHIAMMEDEVVRRRSWISRERFMDMLGATNLIPGPNSTEMAIHIGYVRAGFAGLLVAGCCFILPAAAIVSVIAWAYVRFGHVPQVSATLYGVKPVVIAIVAQALWRLGRLAIKTRFLAAVGIVAAVLNYFGLNELILLFGVSAFVALVEYSIRTRRKAQADGLKAMLLPLGPGAAVAGGGALAATAIPVGLWPLFLVFLKIGSVLFGSGYVLLAFLRADFVQRLHWLTESQLLDATAVGQVTPGPVFTTATFIGWLLAGPKGAAVATIGIFLPAFFFVAITAPFIHRLRNSPIAAAFLDGLNVASLALMAVVTLQLARAAITDATTATVALTSALLLFFVGINTTWLVLGGALVGIAVTVLF